ncbi:hypothetical protein CCP3SC5AM1_1220003 [Gammaproteobacteria bacterium]
MEILLFVKNSEWDILAYPINNGITLFLMLIFITRMNIFTYEV